MKTQSKMSINSLTAFLCVLLLLPEIAFAGFKIEVTPKPNPPESGQNEALIFVKDDAGKFVPDAKIDFLAYMPAMGAMPRMEARGKTTEKGDGQYIASYELSMGGTWEIDLVITKGSESQKVRYSVTTGIEGIADKNVAATSGASASSGASQMNLGPERLQKIGVRFAEVKKQQLTKELRAVGVVEMDNTRRSEVVLRYPGFVEKVFKGRVGDNVSTGAQLFSIYSPDLVSAQSEFILGLQSGGAGHIHSNATERLKNLGLSESDVAQLRKTRKPVRNVTVVAPISGSILEVNVREGSSVEAGEVLYVIGDLSKTFIVARVFQQDLADIRVGNSAEIIVPQRAGDPLDGRVDLVYPNVNEGAGTANVRVRANKFSGEFRPGLYVDVRFPVNLGMRLSVPSSAVLFSGLHSYVFAERGPGVLEPVEVVTGKVAGDKTEILSGLKEGDKVVASGTFLLSSEAQLSNALPKWRKKDEAK